MEYKRKVCGIANKKSKGFSIETLFERFPHLTEQIFGQLKGKCLPICKGVSRIWSNKIEDYILYLNRKILKHSEDSDVYENEWKLAVEKIPLRYLMAFEKYVCDYKRKFNGKCSPLDVFSFYQRIDRQLPIRSFKIMLENIPMSYGAKLKLTIELEKLTRAHFARVVDIVVQNEPNLNNNRRIDVDLEKMKPVTLRGMEYLIVMKNSKEKFEDIQRSYDSRKRLLALEINKLPGTELEQLVNIITQKDPDILTTNQKDIEVDFTKMKPSTLRSIENFTSMTLKKNNSKNAFN